MKKCLGIFLKKIPFKYQNAVFYFFRHRWTLRKEIDQNIGSFGPECSLERTITRDADEELNFQCLGRSTHGQPFLLGHDRSWRMFFFENARRQWFLVVTVGWWQL